MQPAAVLLLSACLAASARTAPLPTDLQPKVHAGYQPEGSDERAIWQNLARVEDAIRDSPQRWLAPELEAYTRSVVERLIGRPAPDLRIYLMRDASLNAAMLPSGMMMVNSGLLVRVRNEAQLAAVLGHEAGHYFRKHSLDLHRDTRRKSAITAASASALNRYDDSYGSWSQINYAVVMSSFRFSRDLESEADAYGLMLMSRAGYPPSAAAEVWGQLIDERRASAVAHGKRYVDKTRSALSTHPATARRMTNLVDTAISLEANRRTATAEDLDAWESVIQPHLGMLLREQIHLNDPGASLYLLGNLARSGRTGLLRFNEGEIHRLRGADGDDVKAAAAYAAAVAMPDAPPEAWRAHGFALLKAGRAADADAAFNRYLVMRPDAPDAAAIRFAVAAGAPGVSGDPSAIRRPLTIDPGPGWRRLPGGASEIAGEAMWTWGGPQTDRMAVISELPDGKAIASQAPDDDQKVPVFRAGMTMLDLASMLEVSYRVNGVTVFDFEAIEPAEFLGGAGVRLRYRYVSGIGFEKRGDCVMRVVGGKLYALKLESLANQAFDAVAPEFDRLVSGARLSD